MGFEFNHHGWYTIPSGSADLCAIARAAYANRPEWSEFVPNQVYAITGTNRNHLVFATESKWDAYHSLRFLADIARQTPMGRGLVTIVGECPCDRDKMIVVYNGTLHDIPVNEVHEPPWNDLDHACHDLAYAPSCDPHIVSPFVGLHELALPDTIVDIAVAWISIDAYHAEVNLEAIREALAQAHPTMASALSTQWWWSGAAYVLLADDRLRASYVLQVVAEVSMKNPRSAGIVCISAPNAALQPFLVFGGKACRLSPVPARRVDSSEYPVWNGKKFTGLVAPE